MFKGMPHCHVSQQEGFLWLYVGITTLLQTPTPREYLRCRLTPDMEHKLLFILQNVSKRTPSFVCNTIKLSSTTSYVMAIINATLDGSCNAIS